MAKGNYETEYYVCANMNYDLGCYDSEFRKNNIAPILYGSRFSTSKQGDVDFSHLQPPDLPGCIVEIHALGPDTANVGIYTDDLANIPDSGEVRMIFDHVGNGYFERAA